MKYKFLRFPEGKAKAVTFSYDDGNRADIKLVEELNKYGLKCTFNVCSNILGKVPGEGALTPEEIQTYLLDKGHDIAVHGNVHKAPSLIRPVEGIEEILTCRYKLEEIFGRIIRGMAYPDTGVSRFHNQASYESIRRYLQDLDITYARTAGGDNDSFRLPDDWYAWMPTAHHDNPLIMEYIDKFLNFDYTNVYRASREPKLFFIWGHSAEFRAHDNWEHLTEICEKISGKKDVWYATNTEIYEYVHAYHSLVQSADGKRIYNPTLHTVWFEIDNQVISIASGETFIYND